MASLALDRPSPQNFNMLGHNKLDTAEQLNCNTGYHDLILTSSV